MKIRILLAGALAGLYATTVLAGQASDAVAYFYENFGGETEPDNRDRFAGPARSYLDANDRMWTEKEEVCLDFALSIDGQDLDEEELSRTLVLDETVQGEEAVVVARFALFGEPRAIEWTLRRQDGVWRVWDIAGMDGGWRMSELTCG